LINWYFILTPSRNVAITTNFRGKFGDILSFVVLAFRPSIIKMVTIGPVDSEIQGIEIGH